MSLARDAFSKQQSKIANGNGLFGDTQYDGTSMFGDTSDFSEANQRKVLEPFQAKIDAAQRELDNLIKARDGYIKQAEGQKSIESKSVGEESPKSKDELQEEPKPIGKGPFGNIYDQFKGKAKEAFNFLIKHKDGDLQGVFHRDEIGDIDLVWGDAPNDYDGKGLAHIIRKHIDLYGDFLNIDSAIKTISNVINKGNLRKDGGNTAAIEDGMYRVVIAKNEDSNWILTAFDYVTPKGEKLKRKDAVAKDTPEQPDVEAGAVTSNLSNSKDINKTLNTKELEEKSNIEPQKQLEEQKQQDDSQQIENAAIKVVAEKSYKSPIHQRK